MRTETVFCVDVRSRKTGNTVACVFKTLNDAKAYEYVESYKTRGYVYIMLKGKYPETTYFLDVFNEEVEIKEPFTLKAIKKGMSYAFLCKCVRKQESMGISDLPSFCGSNYKQVTNYKTDKSLYVLLDYDTGMIVDVTNKQDKAINFERADRNISEILHNNGY